MGVDETTVPGRRRVRTRRRTRAAAAACALLLAVGGVAACGDDNQSAATTGTAATDAALCTSVNDFQTSLAALKGISLTGTSQTDLANIFTDITTAWSGLKTAMKNAADADKANVQTAFDDLRTAVTTLPGGDTSIDEYVANVKAKVPPLEEALQGLAPGCDATGTTTGTTTGTVTGTTTGAATVATTGTATGSQ